MPSRYIIALALASLALVAVAISIVDNIWLIPAAIPFALSAALCIAPRSWLSNPGYQRAITVLAYASMIPAAVGMAAAIGVTLFVVLILPPLCAFAFAMWPSRRPAD